MIPKTAILFTNRTPLIGNSDFNVLDICCREQCLKDRSIKFMTINEVQNRP